MKDELFWNRLIGIVVILIGALTIFIGEGLDCFIFSLFVGGLFLVSKENCTILEPPKKRKHSHR